MLATLSELKSYLGITDNSQDALLQIFLDSANATIESSTGREFGADATDRTETLDGLGQYSLFLSKYPVISFAKLEKNEGTKTVPVWSEVDADSYWLDMKAGIVNLSFPASRGFQEYRATYKGGYATSPSDLKMACLQIASGRYLRKGADGIRSESVNGDSLTYEGVDVPQSVESVLNLYRRPYV